MLLLFLGVVLILIGFLMLIWPRRKQNDAQGARRLDHDHEIQGQEPRRWRTETEETENDEKREKTCVKGGAVVMIGPIPIVIGSDPKIALFMMIIALTIMILWALAVKGN